MNLVKTSKFFSYILRHNPEKLELNMDLNGWVSIDEFIINAKKIKNLDLTFDIIKEVVDKNDKKRYKISEDGKKIRANQGHSIDINLELQQTEPPEYLYHGTSTRFLEQIINDGLRSMSRQYVHLSINEETAISVGKRHGEPVVLTVKSKLFHQSGGKFYLSENKVWLIDSVPPNYIIFPIKT